MADNKIDVTRDDASLSSGTELAGGGDVPQ